MITFQIHKPCKICLGFMHRTIMIIHDDERKDVSFFLYPWYCDECGILSEAKAIWFDKKINKYYYLDDKVEVEKIK